MFAQMCREYAEVHARSAKPTVQRLSAYPVFRDGLSEIQEGPIGCYDPAIRAGHHKAVGCGPEQTRRQLAGSEVRFGDITCRESLRRDGFRYESFDTVVSCLASRTGGKQDSWRVDHRACRDLLDAGQEAGAQHFVLLSAICVQKPRLAFQFAKLRMERELMESGMGYSIVRPTAFFKSLAGQVEAVQKGRPYVMFGNGETACRPIAEEDLAAFMADCVEDARYRNRVLPIGGPGETLNARERGELLFAMTGRPPRIRRVPVSVLTGMVRVLDGLSKLSSRCADAAELARIGRYYATESMLYLNPENGCYDAAATPAYGRHTLEEFYSRVLRDGLAGQELGDHAIFGGAGRKRAF